MPVLVKVLQGVGIYGDNLSQKFAYVPLAYLLRYIEFGLGGVALVLSEWAVYGSAPEALFVVASALHVRCGSCFHVIWNQEREKLGMDMTMTEDTSGAIKVGIEAMKKLIAKDLSNSAGTVK